MKVIKYLASALVVPCLLGVLSLNIFAARTITVNPHASLNGAANKNAMISDIKTAINQYNSSTIKQTDNIFSYNSTVKTGYNKTKVINNQCTIYYVSFRNNKSLPGVIRVDNPDSIAYVKYGDIYINSDKNWGFGYNGSTSTNISFLGTVMHELGHTFGMKHDTNTYACLNATPPNGGWANVVFHATDRAWGVALIKALDTKKQNYGTSPYDGPARRGAN